MFLVYFLASSYWTSVKNYQVFEEKAYLVGVARKYETDELFSIEESLKELAQLADTAGLMVVDSTYQKWVTFIFNNCFIFAGVCMSISYICEVHFNYSF